MKTATVRELRNNFAKLTRWLRDGEKVFKDNIVLTMREEKDW